MSPTTITDNTILFLNIEIKTNDHDDVFNKYKTFPYFVGLLFSRFGLTIILDDQGLHRFIRTDALGRDQELQKPSHNYTASLLSVFVKFSSRPAS